MVKNAFRLVASALLLSLAGISCTSGPEPVKAPDWVYNSPATDSQYTWFVGYSESDTGSEAQAFDDATASIVAEIVRYMGVKVTAESTATAKSDLETLERSIEQTVKQSSDARMAGFQVEDRFVMKKAGGGIAVYILGKYITKDLEAEKNRIAAVFKEQLDAVSVPENEGRSLLSSGDIIAASRKFIEAAAAAIGADIDNADIKFERNINAAKGAMGGLNFVKLNDNLQAAPGNSFPETFKARAEYKGRPLAQVPVLVSYQYKMPNGRMGTRRVNLVSDAEGTISFEHPLPDFVGKASLTMRLDLSAATEPLYAAPFALQSMVAGLEDEIVAKRVVFEYTVVSNARTIPTAVFIVDLDASENASTSTSSSSLQQALTSNGFTIIPLNIATSIVLTGNDVSIPQAIKAALGSRAKRAVWGITRVVRVKDDMGQKMATVSADVKVADLSSGQILYTLVKQAIGMGANEQQAIDAARRQLAQKAIGQELAASLP